MTQSKEHTNHPCYIDDPDRQYSEWMQNPETQISFLRLLLDMHTNDWPDMIMLSDLPQVPSDQIDALPVTMVWRASGKARKKRDVVFYSSDQTTSFYRPVRTQFVFLELGDGTYVARKWNPEEFGPYGDIPDCGLTPKQFLHTYIEGGGTEGLKKHFENLRKKRGGASKTHWRPQFYPPPKSTLRK